MNRHDAKSAKKYISFGCARRHGDRYAACDNIAPTLTPADLAPTLEASPTILPLVPSEEAGQLSRQASRTT
ncbi:MAG: hypothetical protein U0703_13320 [Anaerolineae bacterium]